MQAHDTHQEARLPTPGCSEVFQSGLETQVTLKRISGRKGHLRLIRIRYWQGEEVWGAGGTVDALGAKRQSMHAHTGITHAHSKSPRAQGTKPTRKPRDSTLTILTDTHARSRRACGNQEGEFKSIQFKITKFWQQPTHYAGLWRFQTDQRGKRDTWMSKDQASVTVRLEAEWMRVGGCWKHRGRGTWAGTGTGIRIPAWQWALPKC